MGEYKYTATTSEGVIVSNVVLADTEDEVRALIDKEGLFLVNLRLLPEAKESFTDKFLKRVSETDKAQFLEYFASMLESGLSINEALEAFYEDLDKPLLRKFVKDTELSLRNGRKLSECFEAYPKLFPPLYVGMVKVGEATGTLAESLRHLANQLKKSNELKSKVRNAMIYPIILFTTLFTVIFVLLVFVFPKVQEFFGSSGLELPVFTRVLISLSDLVRNNFIFVALLAAVGIYAYRTASKRSENFRLRRSRFMLKFPIIGGINKSLNVALFARTFGSLLSSGVNILESVDVVRDSLKNESYKQVLVTIKEDLTVGNTLADSLKKYPHLFSPFEVRVLSISERTGEVAKGLTNIAEFYEARVSTLLGGLSAAIEPVMLLFMGGVVVAVALSVITPIFQLLSGVNSIK
ncbi:MAG: type II secretion system F family protein [Candidatus Doudnabacteria bacterium]|nr:type II secretion system F family protein [Candidatus Doudnabacteria bacterium]